jgi:tetratricopeptide (TPR) repeat protein/predicted Ser/Thr protein kinase
MSTLGEAASADSRDHLGHVPVQIGQYRILGVLGAGGMGVVYRAEQRNPKREVALKVLRPGSTSTQAIRRFEHESHVLAHLHHPSIAQVYSAGTADTAEGAQPFFAMEMVHGESLTSFAASHELNTRSLLELVVKLCDAVHHAHQKGVIHRDLKPGNIIVDDTGQPKILDFGVARVTDGDVQLGTVKTRSGEILGTVPYMSPEQVAGVPEELDIRSDVYTLGVLLYELLAGRLPYVLDGRGLLDVLQVIKEEEPIPLGETSRQHAGDLDTIVAKALHKEKTRRYQSAAELGADIRRYLADEPISARPANRWYQLRKFARRNRVLIGGIVATVLALLAGTAVATVFGFRARHQRNIAQKQTEIAESRLAETYFQSGVLAARQGNWISALENYRKAREVGFENINELSLKEGIAKLNLNLPMEARSRFKSVADGGQAHEAAEALVWLGVVELGHDTEKAREHFAQALETRQLSGASLAFTCGLLADDTKTAVRHLREAVAQDLHHLYAYHILGYLLIFLGERDEAAAVLETAKRIFPEDPNTRLLQAIMLASENRIPEAKRVIAEFKTQAGETQLQVAEPILELVALAGEYIDKSSSQPDWAARQLPRVLALQAKMLLAIAEQRGTDASSLAICAPPLEKSFGHLVPFLQKAAKEAVVPNGLQALLPKSPSAYDEISGAIAVHPEGTLFYLRGLLLRKQRKWAEAEKDFEAAAELPAFLPVRKQALWYAAEVQWRLADVYGETPNEAMRAKCVANIQRLLSLLEAEGGDSLSESVAVSLANKAWQAGARNLGRQIISLYQENRPITARLLYIQAGIEYSEEAYGSSFFHAQEAMKLDPDCEVKPHLEELLRYAPEEQQRQTIAVLEASENLTLQETDSEQED